MTSMAVPLLLIVAAAYLWGVERVWRHVGRGRLITAHHVLSALAGLTAVGVALVPPMDDAAHRLLSAHMIQHLLLLVPAAVFLANARMGTALPWLLPVRARRRLARSWPPVRRWARAPGWLAVVWTAHVAVMLVWHVPDTYESALSKPLTHLAEHVSMAGTGIALWWTVWRTKAYGPGAAYAAAAGVAGSALGVLMVFSQAAWYPTYVAAAEHGVVGAIADQQLAGAVMWVVGGVGYLAIAVALFVAWLQRAERRADDRWRRQAGSLTTWLLVLLLGAAAIACRPGATRLNPAQADKIEQGRGAVVAYGCVACHQVPHVDAPQGDVGPSLHGFANRRVIAGQLPNTPANIARWVQDPQAIDPGNVMPTLGVSDADAAAIAAFLATLE